MGQQAVNQDLMNKSYTPYILIILLGAALFLPFLGSVHLFDWDEINFAESAREMLLTGNYSRVQINFQPFWEKPPLFIWMQALSMQVFGVNEFAARFPNALCGVVSLLLIFHLGKTYFSTRLGWLWVFCYLGTLTPHMYFKSGIIDPWFNLFIFTGIVFIAKGSRLSGLPRTKKYAFAGLFIGLALLTKGPAAVLIALLCVLVVLALRRFRFFFSLRDLLVFTLVCALVSFAWYGAETMKNGLWFISEFIRYQLELFGQDVAGHAQPWYYHPIVLLIGCFPVSIFALRAIAEPHTLAPEQKNFRTWMAVLFWVVLILFSIVKTKIIHYSSLCYLPLTFIAAHVLETVLNAKIQFRKPLQVLMLLLGILLGMAFMLIPLLMVVPGWKTLLLEQLNDPFAVANFLLPVNWTGFEAIAGFIMLAGIITAFVFFRKRRFLHGFLSAGIGTALCLQLVMYLQVPKIEQHTQGPAIRFFESLKGKDVYAETLGYKSYAQYFYSDIQAFELPPSFYVFKTEKEALYVDFPARDKQNQMYKDWLLNGDINKDAYFSCKNINAQFYRELPQLDLLYEEGGFVFFRRPKSR